MFTQTPAKDIAKIRADGDAKTDGEIYQLGYEAGLKEGRSLRAKLIKLIEPMLDIEKIPVEALVLSYSASNAVTQMRAKTLADIVTYSEENNGIRSVARHIRDYEEIIDELKLWGVSIQ